MRSISFHWGSRDSKVMIPIGDDNTGRTRTPFFAVSRGARLMRTA